MKDHSGQGDFFRLKADFAEVLRCVDGDSRLPVCGVCENCLLASKLSWTKEWFVRAGEQSKRRFVLGITRRIHSPDLLEKLEHVLQPTLGKDFTYSRSSVNPSLLQDLSRCSSDRALDKKFLNKEMAETWEWFTQGTEWTKANYALGLFQLCNAQILHVIGNLIRVLLVRERSAHPKEAKGYKELDHLSLSDSHYSYRTEDHPELELLIQASEYKAITPATDLKGLISPEGLSDDMETVGTTQSESTRSRTASSLIQEVESLCRSLGQGDAESEGDAIYLDEPALMIVPTSFQSTSGVSRYKDFIRCLPVYLAKYILGFLDAHCLNRCQHVSKHWCFLIRQMQREGRTQKVIQNEAMVLQGTSPKGVTPAYAKVCDIPVPKVTADGEVIPLGTARPGLTTRKENNLAAAYSGLQTERVRMEERNIYCGHYNVLVLSEEYDNNRVIHYSGGNLVAVGSSDRKARFLDVTKMKKVPTVIHGHAGSIRVVRICEQRGFILTGSFDLSIRCWKIKTGACMRIFRGHTGTIRCLELHENRLVSGARDCWVKVWNLLTAKCIRTFKHKQPILSVGINDTHVVSSCEKGLVMVWHIESYTLVKALEGHHASVTCLSFDQWHLISGSVDGYVMAWSMLGKCQKCLGTFRHPKTVLCLKLLYLRVISGCGDGKIRIFSLLSGEYLRVLRANSQSEPILSFSIVDNRIVMNSPSSILVFQFEEVKWDYALKGEQEVVPKERGKYRVAPLRKHPYTYVRAQRMRRVGSSNRKIYHRQEDDSNEGVSGLSHHTRSLSARSMQQAQSTQLESMKPASWSEVQSFRRSTAYIDLQPEFYARPPSALRSARPAGGGSLEPMYPTSSPPASRASNESERELESEHMHSTPRSALAASEQDTLQRIKKRGPHRSVTPDQILLAVGTIQHSQKSEEISSNMEHNMKVRDAWGPPISPPEPTGSAAVAKTQKQQKVENQHPTSALRSPGAPLEITKIITPFEVKQLELNQRCSLHGQKVSSTIPKPVIVRPRSLESCGEKTTLEGRNRRPLTAAGQKVGNFTTTSQEPIQSTRMLMRSASEILHRRSRPEFSPELDPYRNHTDFCLRTPKQQEEYERKWAFHYNMTHKVVTRSKDQESKKAWLMKIKGLPIDEFTKEGKVAAPELGPNVYI
ncbi:F-box and WD repeat domain containing protein 10B isoform X2 [Latimeria chalumnae]|uniref:F-box and WD repeat domain containing protein 10B isoform X2 n=1 Tax=Latimeria chalumnae TaxID=7897 RepID=UPI00313E5DD7